MGEWDMGHLHTYHCCHPLIGIILSQHLCSCDCSLAQNQLTGEYGDDMSGVEAIAAALPKTQISHLK